MCAVEGSGHYDRTDRLAFHFLIDEAIALSPWRYLILLKVLTSFACEFVAENRPYN